MNKQALMTKAHKIAKSIVAAVGDYQVAMKIALTNAWGEMKMNAKITVTSKTGTVVELIKTATGIEGMANGVSLPGLRLEGNTLKPFGAVRVGGKAVKISIELDDTNAKRAAAMFAESSRQIDAAAAELADYDARTARIYATA